MPFIEENEGGVGVWLRRGKMQREWTCERRTRALDGRFIDVILMDPPRESFFARRRGTVGAVADLPSYKPLQV